jgi:hypothetical protein
MLIAYQRIKGTSLQGIDETVGHIEDLFFDGESWQVRYVVADTGKWLPGRKVLLPPAVVNEADWGSGIASLSLTRQQVKESPDIDTQQPVSRQMESELFQHYNVPMYWGPAGAAIAGGAGVVPSAMDVSEKVTKVAERKLPNLRSANAVGRYYIHATDGDIGHVEDLIIDDQAWAIRYIAIDTKNWLPARKVLVSPQWIESISWAEATVDVDLTRAAIKGAPQYDPNQPVNRAYEEHLYDYYGRQRYWLPETTWNQPTGKQPPN